MLLADSEHAAYLANVLSIAYADGVLSPKEQAVLEEIRTGIGAKKGTLTAAQRLIEAGGYTPVKVGPFAAQIANLADMIYLCLVDGELAEPETKLALAFGKLIGITQDQLSLLSREATARVQQKTLAFNCPACGTAVTGQAKFCPHCGKALGKTEDDTTAVKVSLDIPTSGYAIEFCDSTAAGFPAALAYAKQAPSFTSAVRNKKTWYLAAWPRDAFAQAAKLAQLLSGLRNRRCYQNGQDINWDEQFGFAWCAQNRDSAYRPVEYCFGKDDNRLNPWSCRQAGMDWTEWADWFSYGQFKKSGLLRNNYVWVFDKERIRHEIMTNIHRYRYCPYLRAKLINAVVRALPDEVEVTDKGPWRYNRIYEELPGSIKIVEKERRGDYTFTDEYYADGVRPRGLGILPELIKKAFTEIGVTDITVTQLTT